MFLSYDKILPDLLSLIPQFLQQLDPHQGRNSLWAIENNHETRIDQSYKAVSHSFNVQLQQTLHMQLHLAYEA